MTNHLRPPQKTLLRQYFAKTFILQGFQAYKISFFCPFLPYFLPISELLTLSHITKKIQKPLFFLRFRDLLFSPIRTGNPLFLSILIYFI